MADEQLVAAYKVSVATAYAVSKHASNMLVAKYHGAVSKEGILVFSMSPGLVDTHEDKPLTQEDVRGQQALGAIFAEAAPHFAGELQ